LNEGPVRRCANPAVAKRGQTPCLLNAQNVYIDTSSPRIVVPLWHEAEFGPRARHLNAVFIIGADNVVLDTAARAAVPRSELRNVAANLHEARHVIQEALDTLFATF
jgi:hypothetical protein